MIYDIEVRPGPDSDFFQYYTETVEALTSHDAIAKVQRRNPGCNVRCTNSYSSSDQSSSSSFDGGDGFGMLVLGLIVFAIWLVVEYWFFVLPIVIIIFGGWIYSKTRDS